MRQDNPNEAGCTDAKAGTSAGSRSRYAISAFFYARALALVAACAFVSLWTQVEGLYSERGLTPVSELFDSLASRPDLGFLDLPTLAWLWPSATAMSLFCAAGTLACLLLFLGLLPIPSLLVAWASYLSLLNAGSPWTNFQWDLLLVEVLLASTLFVVPGRIDRFDSRAEPSVAGRWVIWLLLFRLMFRSGFVKLASGDPTWADLRALDYHYFTQPLPTVLGWYAAHLPAWWHATSCAVMFGVELVLPFFILIPARWARRTAAAGFAGLMLSIALTGSYGFFNLLTLVLALTLVDDEAWRRLIPAGWLGEAGRRSDLARPVGDPTPSIRGHAPGKRVRDSLAVLLAALGMLGFASGLAPGGLDPIAPLRPWRFPNDYGLFSVMTTTRPEIELEGSRDGITWTPYVFRYKVGPVDRAPVLSAPHQPRVDWQMWFAALDPSRENPWLERLLQRLLENEPAVLELLADDPFPDEPPRFVRALLYDYRPTSLAERARTGAWWTRELLQATAPIGPREGR